MDGPLSFRWLDLIGAPLLLLGVGGAQVLRSNEAFRQLLDAPPPLLPCPLAGLLGAGAEQALRAMVGGNVLGQFTASLTVECEIGGRAPRRLLLHVASLPAPRDHWLITLLDPPVVAAPQAEALQMAWRQDLEAILGWLPIGVEVLDRHMNTVFANAYLTQLFGYSGQEVRYFDDWMAHAFPDPDYRAQVIGNWDRAFADAQANNREFMTQEWDITCKDGSRKAILYRYRTFHDGGVGIYSDVSRERRLQAELRALAETDGLTGLHNRRYFLDAAARWFEAAQSDGSPLSVLFLDLDHFKQVNDRYGHATGDLALKAVAERFHQALRRDDLAARLGGEEFGVLLRETTETAALQVAERLRTAIAAAPVEAGTWRLDLTVSIGGASRQPGDLRVEALIERADRSVYAAKNAGRNCIRFAPAAGSSTVGES